MEFVLFLILGFVAISALVKVSNLSNRLARVDFRLAEIEQRLSRRAPYTEPPTAAAAPPEPPVTPVEVAAAVEDVPEQFRETAAPEPQPAMPGEAQPAAPPPGGTVPPAATPAPGPSLEERFGTRWVVWIGGFALAVGGFFLVRDTGPGVLMLLGALLAIGLVAAGEWLRRKEKFSGFAGLPSANIPSILTAAGTAVAYATVWSAYALWSFLDPAVAFILLGAVALGTLAAALLHGPWVAGLGLIGAYLAPALVATKQPNFWALYVYLTVVTAAAFALARMRLWRWLAFTAVAFSFLWLMPALGELGRDVMSSSTFHAVAGYALVAAMIVSGLFYGPSAIPGRIDRVSSITLSAYVLAMALLVISDKHDPTLLVIFTGLVVATVGIAWRTDAAVGAVPAVALFSVVVVANWAFEADLGRLVAAAGVAGSASPQPLRADVAAHLTQGAFFGLLFAMMGFFVQGRSISTRVPTWWATAGVVTPVLILIALYWRISNLERSIPFALIALALAALSSWITEQLGKRATSPGLPASTAIYATGAVVSLALAFTFALEKGWLTIGLALMVPGIAWVAEKRPLPALRWLAGALVVLVVLRTGWEPRIVGDDIGKTPIFNWLLYGYGVPAAAFWVAGWLMRRRGDDHPSRTVDAGALLFTVLLALLEIRHFMNDGDIYSDRGGLAELGTEVCVGLAMTIGLEHVRERTGSLVHNIGAQLIAGITLLTIVFGLGIAANPLITGEPVGGLIFNRILLGYGIPAALAIALALRTRGRRSNAYRITLAVIAVGLALGYLSLEVSRVYQGPVLTAGPISDAEQYTYSVVWLAFGIVLLIAGVYLQSQPARLASAAIVTLTVAKVFILDMQNLAGAWRALSFIGLGLVLVCIGLLYQRLLFPRSATAPVAPSGGPVTS